MYRVLNIYITSPNHACAVFLVEIISDEKRKPIFFEETTCINRPTTRRVVTFRFRLASRLNRRTEKKSKHILLRQKAIAGKNFHFFVSYLFLFLSKISKLSAIVHSVSNKIRSLKFDGNIWKITGNPDLKRTQNVTGSSTKKPWIVRKQKVLQCWGNVGFYI